MDPRIQAVETAIEAIAEIPDPEERARVATGLLEVLHTANGTVAKLRRQDIIELRQAGRTYRDLAAAIGVNHTRIRQIELGEPMGNSARGRLAKAEPQDD